MRLLLICLHLPHCCALDDYVCLLCTHHSVCTSHLFIVFCLALHLLLFSRSKVFVTHRFKFLQNETWEKLVFGTQKCFLFSELSKYKYGFKFSFVYTFYVELLRNHKWFSGVILIFKTALKC